MTVKAEEALKAFDSEGDTQEVDAPSMQPTPSIKLQDDEGANVGSFVQGKFLARRVGKGQNGEVVYIDIRLIETNAKATVKKGTNYVTADVKPGDVISIYASRRLDRQLATLEPGTDFIAVYKGMIRVPNGRGGKVSAHDFQVKAKKVAELSADDVAYIKARSTRKTTKVDVENENERANEEAESNLSSLED